MLISKITELVNSRKKKQEEEEEENAAIKTSFVYFHSRPDNNVSLSNFYQLQRNRFEFQRALQLAQIVVASLSKRARLAGPCFYLLCVQSPVR